jgi:hypothetical protein
VKITGCTSDIEGENRRYFDLQIEMPLRDLFAAFALAGILAKGHGEEGLDAEVAGADAYYFADAALSTREGKRE